MIDGENYGVFCVGVFIGIGIAGVWVALPPEARMFLMVLPLIVLGGAGVYTWARHR